MTRALPPSGFTLVELLVVLALAGLLGTAVLLTVPGAEHGFAREAERLATRLVHARQEAILGTRAVVVTAGRAGHAVERHGPEGWVPLHADPFEPVRWEDGTAPVPDDAPVRFRFDPTGAAEPATLVLAHDGTRIEVALDAHGGVEVDAQAP